MPTRGDARRHGGRGIEGGLPADRLQLAVPELAHHAHPLAHVRVVVELAGERGVPVHEPAAVIAGEIRLRAAKLGYRARYIYQTARFLAERPGWLETIEVAPTEEARIRLLELPGVGRKIADCTLLFGAGRLEAFPIDTWVEKILTHSYQLEGWKLTQLQDFARIHFGNSSGYAQQYLFAAARAGLIRS